MKFRRITRTLAATLFATTALLAGDEDFGQRVQDLLHAQSNLWFGITTPLTGPAGATDFIDRAAATAGQRVKLAGSLTAEFVTRSLARSGDMIAFWPDAVNPTHLIVCIEVGRNSGGTNAGVQRVRLSDGAVETILFGMSVCDGIRTTPWNTVVATEETDDGRAYEILNPLTTTGHWVESRATGVIRTGVGAANPLSANVVQRQALPTMAWEGLEILPSGVVIGGDEERPGTTALDSDGGAIFKFLPTNPRSTSGPISNLADSPLVSGNIYAMTISCQGQGNSSFPQYGQGCEIGLGAWVRLASPNDVRGQADALGATGYYRPEDLHLDPKYAGPGIRFCWANTGNSGANNYAEVVCGVDNVPIPSSPAEWLDTRTGRFYLAQGGTARTNVTTVIANRFWEGDQRASAFDNLDFQPHTGNLYVIEDDTFGEIWACLPDGTDRDIKTDGCVAILSVIDAAAEPTGFIFDASGETAYLVIQHGQDSASLRAPLTPGGTPAATDDLIKITGFKVK